MSKGDPLRQNFNPETNRYLIVKGFDRETWSGVESIRPNRPINQKLRRTVFILIAVRWNDRPWHLQKRGRKCANFCIALPEGADNKGMNCALWY
jgi:hypothetical protein